MGVYDQAQQLADMRFNPQQDAINRRLAQIGQQTQLRNQFADVQGGKARQYVGQAYDTLDQGLAANKDQALGALNVAANQVGQGFRDANALNQAARDQSRSYMEQLAAQTGLGVGVQARQGELEGLANQLFEGNTARDAHHTANLRNWAGQAGSIYDMQIGHGKQMRASSMSDIERAILNLISQNNLSGAEQETDMGDALLELLGERGAYFGEQVNQLSQAEWMRQIEQAKLQQQADQANAELALRASAMADERARAGAAMSREDGRWQAELDLKQRLANQEGMRWDKEFERGGHQYASDQELEYARLAASLRGEETPYDFMGAAKFIEGEADDDSEARERRIRLLNSFGGLPEGMMDILAPPPPPPPAPNVGGGFSGRGSLAALRQKHAELNPVHPGGYYSRIRR